MQIRGTNLSMVRGDSETLNITLKTETLTFNPGDTLELTVRETLDSPERALYKKIVVAAGLHPTTLTININPEDTQNLDFNKTYVYDIQWSTAEGVVKTIVENSKFSLRPEVTHG